MATNQELRHASFRAIGGGTSDLNSDMMAAFLASGVTETEFNGAFIAWLQSVIPSTNDVLADLKNEFAILKGAPSWNELGAFTVFSPADIANLQLWLDASDTSTITESGGDVSQWDDKSANANHLIQGTGSLQPTTGSATIGGKNAITFNNHRLVTGGDLPSMSEQTLVYVIDYVDGGAVEAVTGHEDVFYGSRIRSDTAGNKVDVLVGGFSDGSNALRDSPAWTSDPTVAGYRWKITDNLVETYEKGALTDSGTISTATAVAAGTFAIGSLRVDSQDTPLLGSSIGELILYNRKLTDEEIASVFNYLSAKWGI